jgi:uncharacterized protein YchJ
VTTDGCQAYRIFVGGQAHRALLDGPGSWSPRSASCDDGAVTELVGRAWPETAEELMRSRFEAFRDGDEDWLLASWHRSTRSAALGLTQNPRWRLGSQIVDTVAGTATDDTGIVEFRAT